MKFTYAVVCALLIFWTGCKSVNEFSLINAELTHIETNLGIETDDIIFSWTCTNADTVFGYRILLANDPDLLKKDVGDIWDSGRRFTRDTMMRYDGPALPSGKKLWWKIKAWNQDNQESPFTMPQSLSVPIKDSTQRLVFLGGTLISELDKYPFLESAILRNWPGQSLTFRNIGWPADDVFGLARSQFGSAQNTRSWQPPSAQEGFGSKVLLDHIIQAAPNTLFIGYGPEMAYSDDHDLFQSGYTRLLEIVDSLRINAVLLSPPKQESTVFPVNTDQRNERLRLTTEFIKDQATARGHLFIDLFESLIQEPTEKKYTENGVQLNAEGYHKFARIVLSALGLVPNDTFALELDKVGRIRHAQDVIITNWSETVRGVQFDLKTRSLHFNGRFDVKGPNAFYLNGQLLSKGKEEFK
ncbi:MAG: hypothetical protein HKN76_02565, partial [Saprospiraceae bacterium]|nr:hypothetical protein [Saprospiraceae bacterium]